MYAELERTCKTCGLSKVVSKFTSSGNSPSARSRAKNYCHECQKAVGRIRAAKLRRDSPEKIRDARLRHLYGISLVEYEARVLAQNNLCAICQKPQNRLNGVTKKQENLVVDHDHRTLEVRYLLCHKCNMEVGIVELNLTRILDYLNKFKK